jgi:hypothetical protein
MGINCYLYIPGDETPYEDIGHMLMRNNNFMAKYFSDDGNDKLFDHEKDVREIIDIVMQEISQGEEFSEEIGEVIMVCGFLIAKNHLPCIISYCP